MPGARDISIRPATPDDAPFLAWVMQESDRAHMGRGTWDLVFECTDEERLQLLAELCVAPVDSYVSYKLFLVADVDGERAAALSGYEPTRHTDARLHEAIRLVLPSADADDAIARLDKGSKGFFSVLVPDDTIRVEWVYTMPDHRGLGLIGRLHEALFERARGQGIPTAHVGTYIGNDAAIAAYLKAGFEQYAEVRHADFEALYDSPGIVYFRRKL